MVKSIYDGSFKGKRVLVRVDFNVPVSGDGKINDATRIKAALRTIDKIISDGGCPVLLSHLGRPKGKPNPEFSLKPVADYLDKVLGYKVHFASDCIGSPARDAVASAGPGEIVLLENLRFYGEEEANNPEFAARLAELGDCYVDDAFGCAHRAHASIDALARLFEERYAGSLMLGELDNLGKALDKPAKPFVAIIGGAKISGKIDVIKNLLGKCDSILIGGGMTFTFFKALGYEIGKSILEADKISLAAELKSMAEAKGVKLYLPVDTVIAKSFDNNAEWRAVSSDKMEPDWCGMDIGPRTREIYTEVIENAGTVVWNGPMGVFEMDNFAAGTFSVAMAMAEATKRGAKTIVGGGDSASAITQMQFEHKVTHVSTGGGASLEYLEGKVLPGIAALER